MAFTGLMNAHLSNTGRPGTLPLLQHVNPPYVKLLHVDCKAYNVHGKLRKKKPSKRLGWSWVRFNAVLTPIQPKMGSQLCL